jgi:glycosyltransferase involved in cell wall biosynthesis
VQNLPFKQLKAKGFMLVKKVWKYIIPHRAKVRKKRKTRLHTINKAMYSAAELEYRLQNLGFTERTLAELQDIIHSDIKNERKIEYAKVLACWYANQRNEADARRCLKLLPVSAGDKEDLELLKETAIMEAECLEVLGNIEAGKCVLNRALELELDASLYLAAANLEISIYERIKWVNRALALYAIPEISYIERLGSNNLDCIRSLYPMTIAKKNLPEPVPKVTVIMAAYNAEATIKTALDSIIAQTWPDLEVLVVEDCSIDRTEDVIDEFCYKDPRIRKLTVEENSGMFVAQNYALQEARGSYVTCHDADDWSHPQKIERQALHLLENPEVIGNKSEQVRLTADFKVHRRGKYGKLILENTSSFMFRREPVMEQIGYWDCVRFYADNEFIRRIRRKFGKDSVINLKTGPLAFVRQHDDSLTGHEYFGKHGYIMGVNKHYRECQMNYHQKTDSLYYHFPQFARPFPAPEPMWPKRVVAGSRRRHFDIIIASDFRLTGGNISAIEEEVVVQKQMKLRTGLFQLSRYDLRQNLKKTNPKILDLLDGDLVQMIVYGEKVECDCLIVRHPPVLQERQVFIPDVRAKNIKVIADQAPYESYITKGSLLYDIKRCLTILREYFGKDAVWYPTGPLIRDILLKHHAKDINNLSLAEEDWVGIINVNEWRRIEQRRSSSKIRIGRHSRDHRSKWPENEGEMLSMYPDDQRYEIRVLGGAEVPKKILGQLPGNWKVYKYDEISPKEFLADLDIFVYYTHPDMIETCDRFIVEALATGVPAIIPPYFQKQFGEAAVYVQPSEVKTAIEKLMNSEESYQLQAVTAQEFVEKNYGYDRHKLRINN